MQGQKPEHLVMPGASGECGAKSSPRMNGFDDIPRPFLIGVGGGTASGKSTVCSKIMEQLGQDAVDQKQRQVVIISLESFYHPLSEEQINQARKGMYNFDHPDAFDEDLIFNTLKKIKEGKTVELPQYDFKNHRMKSEETKKVYPADVILFEGILIFYFKRIRDLFNMKLFVDTDADTRLSRRVTRDMKIYGRELDQILHQYTNYVKPAFEEFCLPTKKYADVIIPRGADNTVAIDLIVQHIQELLRGSAKANLPRRSRHSSDSLMVFPYRDNAAPYLDVIRQHWIQKAYIPVMVDDPDTIPGSIFWSWSTPSQR